MKKKYITPQSHAVRLPGMAKQMSASQTEQMNVNNPNDSFWEWPEDDSNNPEEPW